MQEIGLDLLRSLLTDKDKDLFLIIDNTQTLKRAKKMDAIGKLFHHATGKYGSGHILITDDITASMKTIVANYFKRWSIEMLVKDEKQHFGLGYYRVLWYRAVVRRLHLVDAA